MDCLEKNQDSSFLRSVLLVALAALLFLSASCVRIYPPRTKIDLSTEVQYSRLGPNMQFCRDATGSLSLENVMRGECKFQEVLGSYPSFGITADAVWLRFEVEPAPVPTDWYLELATSILRDATVYRVQPNPDDAEHPKIQKQTIESATPVRERAYPHHYFIFPLTNISSAETIYIRVTSRAAMTIPAFLWKMNAFPMRDTLRTFGFGFFFGVMLVMTLYNFFLFISIKDRAYLYYVFYIIAITEFFALISGHAVYILPNSWSGNLAELGPPVGLFASFFALLFARSFLLLRTELPRVSYIVDALLIGHGIAFGMIPFLTTSQNIAVSNIVPLFSIVTIIACAVKLIILGFKPARYFLIAWSALIAGVLLFLLQNLSVIPSGFFSHYSQFFGAGIEAVLLSLALGYRINTMKSAEETARQDLLTEQMLAFEKQKVMTDAFARFVPGEFLDYLGKPNIESVSHGDVVRKEMSVLFTDIRGFTGLSESLGASQTFSFLNQFHGALEPVIQEQGGFIDKFIGDAIMALFPDPARSVHAAIGMIRALQKNGLEKVQIGVGIHFGELMLGTVGSPRRLETTVIGDTVNLASRIESTNKEYGTQIILSDSVYKHVREDSSILARELDAIRVRGKKQPVSLYEVMNQTEPRTRDARLENMSQYMVSMLAYRTGEFSDAKAGFLEYLAKAGEDPVARLYLKRIETLLLNPRSDWEGIY